MNRIRTAPFIHTEKSTAFLEIQILLALLPCIVYAVFAYGIKAMIIIAFSVLVSTGIDVLSSVLSKARRTNITGSKYYFDFSSVINGVIFALMMPSSSSLAVVFFCLLIGIFVAKTFVGGRGNNILHPAVVSRLLAEVLFADKLKVFLEPGSNWFGVKSLFEFNASNNAALEFDYALDEFSFIELFAGRYPGYIGTGCVLVIVIGFIFMVTTRDYKFFAPASFIASVLVFNVIYYRENGFKYAVLALFSSGVLFACTYLLTDITTIAHKPYRGLIAGLFAGITYMVLVFITNGICLVVVPVIVCELVSFCLDNVDFKKLLKSHRREEN